MEFLSLAYQCDHRPVPQPDERFQEVWERATALPTPQKFVKKPRRQNQAAGKIWEAPMSGEIISTFRMYAEALKPQLEICKRMLMRMTQLINPKV